MPPTFAYAMILFAYVCFGGVALAIAVILAIAPGTRRLARRLAVVLVLLFGGVLNNVAVACKDRLLPDTFLTEELADYENVYVIHVKKVVPSKPLADSWYMPPFTFEGKVVKSFKGNQKPGADIWGRTSSGEEPRARCPIHLVAGQDYLLMLNGNDSPFLLPRYGSPYLSSDDKHFRTYVTQIDRLLRTRPNRGL